MANAKYTNKTLPNDPSLFPPPATWLSWVREIRTEVKRDANGDYVQMFAPDGRCIGYAYDHIPLDEGKVRHHYNRAEARKSLMWLGRNSHYRPEGERGRFLTDWAVYEWVEGEWILRGCGVKGESRSQNTFFKRKQTAEEKVHPFDKAAQDAAIASILAAIPQPAEQ